MVSYTRARAEGLGIDCRVGIMQRAERLVLLFAGTLVGLAFRVYDPALTAVMVLIALVSNFTAFQRIAYVRAWEKQERPAASPDRSVPSDERRLLRRFPAARASASFRAPRPSPF